MKCRIASSFGYQSIEPVKTSVAGISRACRSGAKYAVSTPVGIARMRAPGAAGGQQRAVRRRRPRASARAARRRAPRTAASSAIRARGAPAASGRRSTSREALPDHVLDVVLEEDRRHAARRAARSAPRPGSRRRRRPPRPRRAAARTSRRGRGTAHFQRSTGSGDSHERASAAREARRCPASAGDTGSETTRSQSRQLRREPVRVVARRHAW